MAFLGVELVKIGNYFALVKIQRKSTEEKEIANIRGGIEEVHKQDSLEAKTLKH